MAFRLDSILLYNSDIDLGDSHIPERSAPCVRHEIPQIIDILKCGMGPGIRRLCGMYSIICLI